MLRVRDIMTTDVLTLHPDTTLRDAIGAMSGRHVSGVPVLEGQRVVGVLSANGILEFATTLPGVPAEHPDASSSAADEMEAPSEWVEGEEAPGSFFSEYWPDDEASVVERMHESRGPEWDILEEYTVADAMNRTICGVRPDTTVPQAADFMRRVGVHRVLVMESGKLVGIVSTMDITRAVAEHRLTSRRYVFDSRR
jgi:CBS domain-containing protein